MSLSIKLTGKGGIAEGAIPRALATWEVEVAPVVMAAIRASAPVHTGRLRDSVHMERRSRRGGIEVLFTSDVPYAGFVNRGTPPHMIYPRQARMLRWAGHDGGDVYRREVHHPGTRANPFAERTVMELYPWIRERLSTLTAEELTKGIDKEI